jgi:hypothetical protein
MNAFFTLARYSLLLFVFLVSCLAASSQNNTAAQNFPENVGDIPFDASLDDPAFMVCKPELVFQYYNTGSYYKDHKKEIAQYFINRFIAPADTLHQTGYITIRFMINCKGETGRFRKYEIDGNYQPFHFNAGISDQLLVLTKQIKGWQPAVYKDKIYDSYQYITFRIKNGKIVSITP